MNVDVVVGLSNLGPEGRPRDGEVAFDPLMEREAAEALIAEFRREGLAPPEVMLRRQSNEATPRAALTRANVMLASMGLPTHAEPADAPEWKPSLARSLPVSALHRLRRVMAHQLLYPGQPVEPLDGDADARDDPAMTEAANRTDCHLISHSDREGFYLPLSFSQAVHDPTGTAVAGGWVGSSLRLAEELAEIAPLLGLEAPGPDGVAEHVIDRALRADDGARSFEAERRAWLLHAEAADMSMRHGLAIIYA